MLEARILAVADVIEATSAFRPYRPAHGIEIALARIKQKKGKQYDAEVVAACLELFASERFASDFNKFKENA